MVKQKNQKKTGGNQETASANTTINSTSGTTQNGVEKQAPANGTNPPPPAAPTPVSSAPHKPQPGPAPRQNGQPKRDREKQMGSQNSINQQSSQKKANSGHQNGEKAEGGGKPRDKENFRNGYSQNSQSNSFGYGGKSKQNRDHSNSTSSSQNKRNGGGGHSNSTSNQAQHNSNSVASSSNSSTAPAASKSATNSATAPAPTAKSAEAAPAAPAPAPTTAAPPTKPEPKPATSVETEKATEKQYLSPQEAEIRAKVAIGCSSGTKDLIIQFLQHGPWDQQEMQCELLSLTNPIDLRLFANCIDGLASKSAMQFKPLETRANSPNPTAGFPSPWQNTVLPGPMINDENKKILKNGCLEKNGEGPSDKKSTMIPNDEETPPQPSSIVTEKVANVLHTLYGMIALLSANNRKSAANMAQYLDEYVISARSHHLSKMTTLTDKIELLELMGKIVSACLRHPAFCSTSKLKYYRCREEIQCEIEQKLKEHRAEMRSNEMMKANLLVERGVGEVDENEIGKEPRAGRNEPPVLSGALPVSGYGETRSLCSPVLTTSKMPPTNSVFIERFDGCYIDTDDMNSYQIEIHWSDKEKTFAFRTFEKLWDFHYRLLDQFGNERRGDRRILPSLQRDSEPAAVVKYINELSDLPARVMLSRTICEEFYATRSKTDENDDVDGIVLSGYRPPPRSAEKKRHLLPSHNTYESLEPLWGDFQKPYAYGPVPMDHIQIMEASCSNCGGDHSFSRCDKQTVLERKNETILHFNEIGEPMMTITASSSSSGHFDYHQSGIGHEGSTVPVQFSRNMASYDAPPLPPPNAFIGHQLIRNHQPPPPSSQNQQYPYGK